MVCVNGGECWACGYDRFDPDGNHGACGWLGSQRRPEHPEELTSSGQSSGTLLWWLVYSFRELLLHLEKKELTKLLAELLTRRRAFTTMTLTWDVWLPAILLCQTPLVSNCEVSLWFVLPVHYHNLFFLVRVLTSDLTFWYLCNRGCL
jgi:hypothetical protein